LVAPTRSSRNRAWLSAALGLAGVLTLPVAVEVARRSTRVALLDAAYAVPLAFVLGVVALEMARRAKANIRWFRLDGRGTGVASIGVVLGLLAVCLALAAALSVGFYEAILYYQRHH
jgi:hypothetical protein